MFEADSGGMIMGKDDQFLKGDAVRVKKGAGASFYGRVVRVDNKNRRLTIEGRFEGEPDNARHTINVSFSVVEKIEPGDLS